MYDGTRKMNYYNQKQIIEKIFEEIDKIIESNISIRPVVFEQSNFYKDYLKLKEKWLK